DGARYLGLDADLGSIEKGKLADMIVMERNPLDDIRNSDSIRWTILNGRVFDARTMAPVDGGPGKKPHFFFDKMQDGMPMQTAATGRSAKRHTRSGSSHCPSPSRT